MFESARLKLTLWYLSMIMGISIAFSIVIFNVLNTEVERFDYLQRLRLERRLQSGEFFPLSPSGQHVRQFIISNDDLVAETKHRIILILLSVNGAIFLCAGGIGYLLAGRTLSPIKNMVEEQQRFISDASHELKTPLTSLKTAFEVYLKSSPKNTVNMDAQVLVRESIEEVNKLQSLSESLLQLAQFGMNGKAISYEPLHLSIPINEAKRRVASLAKKKKISFYIEDNDSVVLGDKESLIDLFVILFDNAIKYSYENSKVKVLCSKVGGSIQIDVSDNGIGIEKKDLPYIFDRFYRSDKARSKSSDGGYGLGLSIAQEIIRVHKGSISAADNLPSGTTIRIVLQNLT